MRSNNLSVTFVISIFLLSIILLSNTAGYCARPERVDDPAAYWIFFSDKGLDHSQLEQELTRLRSSFNPISVERRQRVGLTNGLDELDLPVHQKYIDEIVGIGGIELRHVSRWLNAISVNVTSDGRDDAALKSFVRHIQPVRSFLRRDDPFVGISDLHNEIVIDRHRPDRDWNLEYGRSLRQNLFLNVPRIHDTGLTGAGIIIGVLDAGFDNLDHNCFEELDILASWDFVNDDDEVGDENDRGRGAHGTKTLSILGGFEEDEFVGVAFEATFVLAKTENTDWERPVEEDHWVAGIEWMDELGVDIASSSLSYSNWYEYEDMDGETCVTTVAAQRAVDVGIIICSSMGNSGRGDYPADKMGAPSDGIGVFSIGATNSDSSYASFSSRGPTFDGRTKPDFTTIGVNVKFAGSRNNENYGQGIGTSFSAPAIAGLCALLLQANPYLNPISMRDVLRSVSDNNEAPDTLLGWGIPDGFAALEAVGFEEVELEIELRAGWSTVSHNLVTQLIDVRDIVGELVERDNLLLLKDGRGRFFSPENNFNNIPWWNNLEGYQISVREEDVLVIEGTNISYLQGIDLVEGWQIVSYLPTFSMASQEAFSSLTDDDNLILAKDDHGRFYFPQFGFSNMPPCRQGSGYKIDLSEDDVLVYPRRRLVDAGYSELKLPLGYLMPEPDESGMSVLVMAGEGVNNHDELAFKDQSGNIIGAGVVIDGYCGIALWGGQNSSTFPSVEYFSQANQQYYDLELKKIFGPSGYIPDEIAVYQTTASQQKYVESVQNESISLHPNPFNNMVTIKLGFNPKAAIRLAIYNNRGQLVFKNLWDNEIATVKVIRSGEWASGNYYFQINHNGKTLLGTARHLK